MNCSPVDLTIIIMYLVGMRVIALYVSQRESSLEGYLFAGRALNGWVAGLSLAGTSISSVTFLAYPADAFKATWLRLLPCFMLPLAILLMARWWLKSIRGIKRVTAYELLEERYGVGVRVYGALVFVISQLIRVSVILYLISLVTAHLIGLEAWLCILITGALVAIYTTRGGLNAVVWTDVVQVITLAVGGSLCLWWVIDLTPGGSATLITHALRDHKVSFAEMSQIGVSESDWTLSLTRKTALMMLIVGFTHWLTEYLSGQSALQRLYSTRNLKEARRALWVCVALSLPLWILFMTLGTALYGLFMERTDVVAQAISRGALPAESLIPHFITHYLPSGLAGFVIAAALAAAMSSLDSALNAIASVVTYDLYYPLHDLKRKLSRLEREDVMRSQSTYAPSPRFARRVTTITALFMICGALFCLDTERVTLRDSLISLSALLSGGLLCLYLFALSKIQVSARDAWFGLSLAGLSTLWFVAASQSLVLSPVDPYYAAIIGNISLLIGVAVSRAHRVYSHRS